MDSPTKRRLTAEELSAVAREAFGSGARVLDARELTEGTFNASYAIHLEGHPPVVLKVAPRPGTVLLRYERDLMRTELDFYERVARAGRAPVPKVLARGLDRKLIDSEWFFMAMLGGSPLYSTSVPRADRRRIRARLGELAGEISKVRGDRFGYLPVPAATWREAFSGMVSDLLADADQYATRLPRSTDGLRRLFERHAPLLEVVREPSLVHFDLWDGNVFVTRGPTGGWELEALIDGERAFWGDPLAELPSASLLGNIERERDFLEGYARAVGAPLVFTPEVRIRIALYRAYLYLIMLVEAAPRAYSGVRWMAIRTLVDLRLRGALRELEEDGVSFAILCSGVALGVYLPGLLLRRDLRRLGVPADVFVLESLFPEDRRQGLRRTRSVFHRDFRAAVAGHKLARDPTPLLDEEASTALLQRWAEEGRRRFVVLSGFWLPLLDRYRSLARGPLDVELCHVDSVDSPSFRATAGFTGLGRHRRLLDAEAGCVQSVILATREAPAPFSKRARPVAHGGGWAMGTYASRAEELARRGWPMDVIGCELEDTRDQAGGSRHFLADPDWEPWRGEPGFPPFGEVGPDGSARYRAPDDHHVAFDLVREAPFVLSKPGGATLLDSLAGATPVVLLEPLGEHERRNAELWERLGFGIGWDRFLALGDPRAELERQHLALSAVRDRVPDYAALLAAERPA